MSAEIDELYNLWEKFTVGEVGMGEITNLLVNLSDLKVEELPKDYLTAAVQHLNALLDDQNLVVNGDWTLEKEVLDTIKILKHFLNQPEVRINQYAKCFKGFFQKEIIFNFKNNHFFG